MGTGTDAIRIGRYEIRRELGRGVMGVVYEAWDPQLHRTIALKTIRPVAASQSERESWEARFLTEARAAARLSHPAIVVVHDVGRDAESGVLYLALEYLKGQTLAERLASLGPLPWQEALRIVGRVAEGLAHAHAQGVVHRDVKPANIMIDPSGQVKVMDFGIAKLDEGGNLTSTGAIMGTPNYMSPEQARGEKVDARSDLFSLGCVLYECLTGTRPFQSPSVSSILVKILTEDPPPVDFETTGLPRAVDDVLSRAVAKDPGRRFATGAEMMAALRRAGGLPEIPVSVAGVQGPAASPTGPLPSAEPAAPPGTPTVVSARPVAVPRLSAPAPADGGPGLLARARALSPRTRALAAAGLVVLLAGGLAVFEIGTRPARHSALVVEEPVGLFGRLLGREPRLRVTVPEGTSLRVSLETPLSSETAAAGDAISGETTTAVRIDGVEALPAHSTVSGHVTHAVSASQGGRAELAFELDSVTLPDGPRYTLRTRPLTLRSGRAARESLKAGLSEVGAAVGGLFSGKKARPAATTEVSHDVTLAAHGTVTVETAEPVAILRPRRP